MDNLCAIIDVNRLGQSDPAPLQHQMDDYKKRVESFGWKGIVVDGHDIAVREKQGLISIALKKSGVIESVNIKSLRTPSGISSS